MPKLRYLKVRFANNIYPYDIPKFRAAVIEKTERKASLFHNHVNEKEFFYRYSLIQYKVNYKKASIICIGKGTDDIHHLLQQRDMKLRIGEHVQKFEVEDIDMHYHQVQCWDTLFEYNILNWVALNQKHHAQFKALEGNDRGQLELLTNILKGNIIVFAKGINWWVEERVQVEITKIKEIKILPIHKNDKNVLAFTLNFKTNVSLPNYIGLGKRVSIGFGVVKQIGKQFKRS